MLLDIYYHVTIQTDFVNQQQNSIYNTRFDEKFCLIFQIQEFIGRMTRIKYRYWIETDTFIEASSITQKFQTEGIQGTKFPNLKHRNHL